MPKRVAIPLTLGPLHTCGDLAKAPEGTSSKIRNCAFRRGVLEKRPGFLKESDASTPTDSAALYTYESSFFTNSTLIAAAETGGTAKIRYGSGTWASISGNCNLGAAAYNEKIFMLCAEKTSATVSQSSVTQLYDAAATANITKTRIGGKAIAQIGGRLGHRDPPW